MESTKSSAWKTMALAGLVAGTMDITGAIVVYSGIQNKATAIQILQSIASGVFGPEAYAGGTGMAITGLVFHYMIASSFAVAYFLVFPKISFLSKQKIVSGLLYGVFVWVVMNRIVLPLSNYPTTPFKFSSGMFIGMGILMVCIGLPISIIVHKYYSSGKA